ncbi:putative phosphoribosylaminoimidazole-succinocarboxamidesynthase [Orientia tsutsugamushi str. TA716]|uniref:Putative phosphoribosylaminoimidazole-succinocarboxamidesynthase n=1 Tax=Orientia tsutsugamushi str. TA716 TaxID=1359175 RepID=A0A0F3NS62_ORITS|nr:putative phosphoribosylaminoimidazole-succinocarboxamidesynthase [Orientia tsutsugamushi str. TA716]
MMLLPLFLCSNFIVNDYNIASGRYVSQFGIEDGYVFDTPIIDFMVKHGANNYPIINEDQMMKFNWVDYYELKNRPLSKLVKVVQNYKCQRSN